MRATKSTLSNIFSIALLVVLQNLYCITLTSANSTTTARPLYNSANEKYLNHNDERSTLKSTMNNINDESWVHAEIERKLQLPMPMHRHFVLQQQHQQLQEHAQKLQNYNRQTLDEISQIKGNNNVHVSTKDNHNLRRNSMNENRQTSMVGNRILDSSWWFRFDEGMNRPETRRSHHSTLYSLDETIDQFSDSEKKNSPTPTRFVTNAPSTTTLPPTVASTTSSPSIQNNNDNDHLDNTLNDNSKSVVNSNSTYDVEQEGDDVFPLKPENSASENSFDENINSSNNSDNNKNNNATRKLSHHEKDQGSTIPQEYMIISGGFTDYDWHTFPVWAFDVTAAVNTIEGKWFDLSKSVTAKMDHNNNYPDKEQDEEIRQICSSSDIGSNNDMLLINDIDENGEKKSDLWTETALFCSPPSRVGHISLMRNEYLYVFGGLLYNEKEGVFFMEDEPFMYRMNIPSNYFSNPGNYDKLSWERITPNVVAPPFSTHSGTSDYVRPEDIVNRGEVRGGYWEKEDKLIMYGGLHVRDYQTSYSKEQQADETLGDVWAYDFKTDTWEIMAPTGAATGNIKSAKDENLVDHPGERTSHSATVVGDELIVYGGLKKVETYLWDGSTLWDQLDDVWVFDLKSLKWKQRMMKESVGRAYHSVVGWENEGRDGTVMASFGGMKTMTDPVDNQQISYVYDDTIVTSPLATNFTSSIWFLATYEGNEKLTIATRLEHTAVLSKAFGNMIVWGGRYRGTSDIDGVWSLNVHGEGNNVLYVVRNQDDQNENIGFAYVVLVTVMLMSMIFTYMCGILHRQIESDEGTNANTDQAMDPSNSLFRRNGLRQDIIDTLQLKTYESDDACDDNETPNADISGGSNNDTPSILQQDDDGYEAEDDDENCCPICLVEYSNGDEIRVLPCSHEFHKTCVDSWLGNNSSCPACRHSLQNLATLSTIVPTQDSENQTEGDANERSRRGRIIRGMTPTILLPRVLNTIRARRRVQPPQDTSQMEVPRTQSENSDNDSDSINDLDLELSHSSSVEWNDNLPPERNGRRARNFRPIETDENELPIHGRSRRMRAARERGRNTRGRLAGRRRGAGARSPLNDPLQPADGQIV